MGILLRYACLLGLGLASVFIFFSATAVTGQRLTASGGYAVQDPVDTGFVVLALIGILGFLSVVKFVVWGFPSMMRDWFEWRRYERRRMRFGPLILACIISMVFLVT